MMDTNITILERFTIAQDSAIGALSGVIALDDALYLVGDDVRYLAKTTLKNRINSSTEFEKIPLFENDKSIGFEPLIKAEKPDFEALTTINLNGQQHILIMGSGSTEKRKQALLYNPSNHGIQTLFNAVDYQFLETYFENTQWHIFMKENGDNGARSDRFAIKDSVFSTMPILLPSQQEQTAIGNFFRQLDEAIASHQRKPVHQKVSKIKQADTISACCH